MEKLNHVFNKYLIQRTRKYDVVYIRHYSIFLCICIFCILYNYASLFT